MRDLPSGTVTFLFTDVEGSTRLLHEHGDRYADLLAAHRRAIRKACTAHGGVEVDTQGDAFFVAFERASAAVAAAADIQSSLEGGVVQVRIGIHTGEPLGGDEGYVGIDVHRAARIAAAAHGGQIVLSRTTFDLLGGDVPVRDLGEHRLKDLVGAEHLFQLGEGSFPPLRTLDATNLPFAAASLIGRQSELTELVRLLSNGSRLVTITGPGGTGKTRLALQVAAELVGRMREGVFWVSLGGLSDPDLVLPEIAQTIGARDDLDAYLRGKELLLLLDNLEHLAAAAGSIGRLLAASGDLRILATSRGPLHVGGERVYPLDPLPPDDAVAFFLERALSSGRQIEVDETVEAICRRLDGLPLALELAAARTAILAPETLLRRLDDALPVLTGGSRDAPERQRTLRATIEWSHDLLDEEAQALFARLAVFAGTFSVGAAEEVCDATLDRLVSLLDLSLLKPIGDDRFLMLETVRQFAEERLAATSEDEDVGRRHAAFFHALGESAYAARIEAEEECTGRLQPEQDNLRAALDWLAANDPDRALELAGALGWFWQITLRTVEGLERLAAALAASDAGGAARARALTAYAALAGWAGDPTARDRMEEALALWRELGEVAEEASALDHLGWVLMLIAGDDPGALAAFERSLELRRQVGDRIGETRALVGVAQVLVSLGEIDRAEELSHDVLDRARRDGDLRSEHFAYHFLADCALIRGNCGEADERYRESLRAALPLGDVVETSFEVQGIAMAAAGLGDARRAVRLAAAIDALWESLGVAVSVRFWNELLQRYVGAAAAELGDEAAAVRTQGRELSFEAAVDEALATPSG